jgi:methionine biosynthesis protein MetW
MTEALQVVQRPDLLLEEMLRIGKRGIVTFPNFGHWRCRLALALGGHMPISQSLPNQWFDTPNIHLCTVRDFERLCAEKSIAIRKRSVVDHRHRSSLGARLFPNLLGQVALYELSR